MTIKKEPRSLLLTLPLVTLIFFKPYMHLKAVHVPHLENMICVVLGMCKGIVVPPDLPGLPLFTFQGREP